MHPQTIADVIQTALPGAQVHVEDTVGDGNHFQAVVIAAQFAGLTMIKQHRMVNDALKEYLDSGQLHALALKTYTPDQWKPS
jgi:acid stress-induced BolA-like protein IbaG/YrbA